MISRRTTLLFFTAYLAIGITLVAQAGRRQEAPVLRGRALELVDERGTTRCRINVEPSGEVVFRLTDQQGVIRVKLGAGADGSGLVLLDEQTEPGIQMVARRTSKDAQRKTTSITLTGAKGKSSTVTP